MDAGVNYALILFNYQNKPLNFNIPVYSRSPLRLECKYIDIDFLFIELLCKNAGLVDVQLFSCMCSTEYVTRCIISDKTIACHGKTWHYAVCRLLWATVREQTPMSVQCSGADILLFHVAVRVARVH